MIQLAEYEFLTIYSYIRKNYGINLEHKKYLIESKLWGELIRCKAASYTEYWQMVRADQAGVLERRMLDLLTINYTYFCREEEHFQYLTTHVIPTFAGKPDGELNIWCAACATGQECYTLAMLLMDCQAMGTLQMPFHILATDLSEKALETAQKARYGSSDYSRLKPHWYGRYCTPFENDSFEILPQVRKHVSFRWHNLLEPLGEGLGFQIVFCRNVLIYFRENERNQLLDTVNQQLLPGGYFFISQTESLPGCKVPLNYIQPAVYQKPEDHTNA